MPGYFIRIWETKDGLPQNAVTAIVQTRDGYLWLGTYDGLAHFDGVSFSVFDDDYDGAPEMRNSRVVSLFEDRQGVLWIGHETGELTRYQNGSFQTMDVNTVGERRKILGLGEDANGITWLLNEDAGLISVKGEIISLPNAGTPPRVSALVCNKQGGLWVLYNGEVFALRDDRLVPLAVNAEILGGYVTGICASRDGGLWIVSGGQIRKWNGRELTENLGPSPWDQGFVTSAIETESGCVAFGTLDKGLYLVFPHRGVLHFNHDNGFPHDWVRSLYEDQEGTLWAGTGSGGLAALRAGKITTVDAPDHWQGMVVLSVTTARDGALWISTEGAGLYRLHDDKWTHFGEEDGLPNPYIWSVSEDDRGRLWVGTWGDGVFVQNGSRFEHPPGLEDITVPSPALLHARNGVIWIGTVAGLLRYDAEKATWFGRNQGLVSPDVRAVVEDHEGGLWFGMLRGGLGHLSQGNVRQFRKSDGLSSDYVQCLHLDTDGTLWIGTYGGGLNRMKHGSFDTVSVRNGLPNNFVCDIEDDGHGNFWFSSHGGIFRISKDELNQCADGLTQSVQCLSYGTGDGMPTAECSGGLQPAGCKTADGRLWFPTSKGLVVLDPSNAKANQRPPPVLIEEMLVNREVVAGITNGSSALIIPPGAQRFEFRYTALSFVAPEKVSFRYRLEGLESEWLDAGTKRAINYSYITPGEYTFRVIACNSDGVWNTAGASLSFIVQAYFWQTWWFRTLEGLAAAMLLTAGVVIATRRRMHRKLERLEHQQDIERERSRIAQDIHDNLGASLTRISLLSQAVHGELDNPAQAAMQLDRIYDTARDLTRSLDEIVWAVNPQHDTLDSLANYLGRFAQDYLGPLQIRCRLDMPLQLPVWPVTAEVRHNLFLAFKEALNNVIRHAQATEVLIRLETGHDSFTLSVRDNGKGFDPDATPQPQPGQRARLGNGLVNMRKRLQKLGGRCEIRSESETGTEVTFVVSVGARLAS